MRLVWTILVFVVIIIYSFGSSDLCHFLAYQFWQPQYYILLLPYNADEVLDWFAVVSSNETCPGL